MRLLDAFMSVYEKTEGVNINKTKIFTLQNNIYDNLQCILEIKNNKAIVLDEFEKRKIYEFNINDYTLEFESQKKLLKEIFIKKYRPSLVKEYQIGYQIDIQNNEFYERIYGVWHIGDIEESIKFKLKKENVKDIVEEISKIDYQKELTIFKNKEKDVYYLSKNLHHHNITIHLPLKGSIITNTFYYFLVEDEIVLRIKKLLQEFKKE